MSKQELKEEISKVIDEIPEPALKELLEYLKQLNAIQRDKTEGVNHIQQILREDRKLLERLAQ